MKPVLAKLLSRTADLCNTDPLLTLFVAGALLCVFLSVVLQRQPTPRSSHGLPWVLYAHVKRLLWALVLVGFLAGTVTLLRNYLHQTVSNFQYHHGRVTEANYNAVQTIWGAEQIQSELRMDLFYDEEITERLESEDLTKPAVLRKKTVRRFIGDNPFVLTRHDVLLRQNPRKKGSALYGGYETVCRFTWRLQNPSQRELTAQLRFALPAANAIYDDLSATLNGQDVLAQMQLKEAALLWTRDIKGGEVLDLRIAFKSRGMSFWYFQVRESREIRDFVLDLHLPDLPKARLNYPEGCMSPTEIKVSTNGPGCVLTYRLDHAISSKGMGISLPKLPQPGAITTAVLKETERGWLLIFAMLLAGLNLSVGSRTAIWSIGFGAAAAFGYGLLGDLSDHLAGFWGTAALVLAPLFLLLGWLVTRLVSGTQGKLLALQVPLYGVLYPSLAGVDAERQTLYLNLCALTLLAITAWLAARRLGNISPPLNHELCAQSSPS